MQMSFEDRLLELDVDAACLRADPSGQSWLPAELLAEMQASEEARAQFEDFVQTELALRKREFEPDAHVDRVFAARVVRRLPERPIGLSNRAATSRTYALAVGYALALGTVWILMTSGTSWSLSSAAASGPFNELLRLWSRAGERPDVALGSLALLVALTGAVMLARFGAVGASNGDGDDSSGGRRSRSARA